LKGHFIHNHGSQKLKIELPTIGKTIGSFMKSAGSLVFEITQTNGSFNSDFFKELEPTVL
jgi:hypothetical protein